MTFPSITRAFQALAMHGVPRERARSIANGIDVLATRYERQVQDQAAEIARLKALLAVHPDPTGKTREPPHCPTCECPAPEGEAVTSKEGSYHRALTRIWDLCESPTDLREASGLTDKVARIAKNTLRDAGETPAMPARDAEHCDFPDCEQHWTLVVEQLVTQCEAYHDALDRMFAGMAARTADDPEPFFPTQSGVPWDACQTGRALIQRVRAAQKTPGDSGE